jgi:hypothetical protein
MPVMYWGSSACSAAELLVGDPAVLAELPLPCGSAAAEPLCLPCACPAPLSTEAVHVLPVLAAHVLPLISVVAVLPNLRAGQGSVMGEGTPLYRMCSAAQAL